MLHVNITKYGVLILLNGKVQNKQPLTRYNAIGFIKNISYTALTAEAQQFIYGSTK